MVGTASDRVMDLSVFFPDDFQELQLGCFCRRRQLPAGFVRLVVFQSQISGVYDVVQSGWVKFGVGNIEGNAHKVQPLLASEPLGIFAFHVKHIHAHMSGARGQAVLPSKAQGVAGSVVIDPDNVQIPDGTLEGLSVPDLKGNSPEAVVVQIDLSREFHHRVDLSMVLLRQFIQKVFPDLVRRRVVEAEMVMEAAGPVDQVLAEGMNVIAGDHEELFAAGKSVEKRQHGGLGICVAVSRLDAAEGFIELVEQNHDLLLDTLQVGADPIDILVYHDYRETILNGTLGKHPCKEGFADALIAAQDHAETAVKSPEGPENLVGFGVVDSINLLLVGFDVHVFLHKEPTCFAEADDVGLRRKLVINLQRIVENLICIACSDNFHGTTSFSLI